MFLTVPSLCVHPDPERRGSYLPVVSLLDPWEYVWAMPDGRTARMRFPIGWKTDMASVPRCLQWIIHPYDLGVAAFPHDLGYRYRGIITAEHFDIEGVPTEGVWTRKQLDRLFARTMRSMPHVPRWKRRMAYRGVRIGGWRAWRQSSSG